MSEKKDVVENSRESKNSVHTYEYGDIEVLFFSSNHEFPLHSHESWCIGLVLEGEVKFTINGLEYITSRNHLFLIPSNTGVQINPINNKRYTYVTICIKNESRKYFSQMEYNQYVIKLLNCGVFMEGIYDFMWTKKEQPLLDILQQLIKPLICVDSLEKKHSISEPVSKAITYMREHANGKFDLEVLAQNAYVSKYHLVRQFKKEMGVSPHQYFLQTKIRIAKQGILENKSELELASELNFSDQSHLCRQFKQMMGVSIQDYKKNAKKR